MDSEWITFFGILLAVVFTLYFGIVSLLFYIIIFGGGL